MNSIISKIKEQIKLYEQQKQQTQTQLNMVEGAIQALSILLRDLPTKLEEEDNSGL